MAQKTALDAGGREFRDDSFDLAELSKLLFRRRWWVTSFIFIGIAIAVFGLNVSPPTHKARIILSPPWPKDIEPLIKREQDKVKYSTAYIWNEFHKNCVSNRLRRRFFNEEIQPLIVDTDQQSLRSKDGESAFTAATFDKSIHISDESVPDPWFEIRFSHSDQVRAKDWLAMYTEAISRWTVEQIEQEVRADIALRKRDLQRLRRSKIEFAELRRQDIITQLEEDFEIARKLEISDRRVLSETLNGITTIEINTNQKLRYLLGTRFLGTQIEVLKNRKSDVPFIPGIRDIDEELAALDGIELDKSSVKVTNIERPSTSIGLPRSAYAALVLMLGALLGLILGAGVVVVADQFSRTED